MGFWEAKLGFIPGSISLECMLRTAAWLGLAGEGGVVLSAKCTVELL